METTTAPLSTDDVRRTVAALTLAAEHVEGFATAEGRAEHDAALALADRIAAAAGITVKPAGQVPTYHGITYAQCFVCGYGTADTTTLEMWNDLGGDCPTCQTENGRIMWVMTGGRVSITNERPDGMVEVRALRLGNEDGTPPDAPVFDTEDD